MPSSLITFVVLISKGNYVFKYYDINIYHHNLLNTKTNMLLEKELLNLKLYKLNLLKFYQGKDLQKGNFIQTAIFKKV